MRLALAQMAARVEDAAVTLARIDALAVDAAGRGARLLLMPELVLPGYGAGPDLARLAEPLDGPLVTALAAIAARHGLALVAGLAEREGECVYNTALFTDGTRRIGYRKTHLWAGYERDIFTPGDSGPAVIVHAGLRVAMLVCYDVEFPENVRRAALAGAQAILVPTALPDIPSSALVTDAMIPVRALESHAYVAYANLCGTDARFRYFGNSRIAGPDGILLAKGEDGETLLLADLDPAACSAAAAATPYLHDSRPDIG